MKIAPQCYPCIVEQMVKMATLSGEKQIPALMQKAFALLGQAPVGCSAPELIGRLACLARQQTGCHDPYLAIRRGYNQLFMHFQDTLRQCIAQSADPFRRAVRYAILANLVDLGPIRNDSLDSIQADLPGWYAQHEDDPASIDHTEQLRQDVLAAKTILCLGDNCGELCMDRLLMEQIARLNPSASLYYGVRGMPVINDSIPSDALEVGMDSIAQVVDNGSPAAGTCLHLASGAFRTLYQQADVVLCKGQGNYESLSEDSHPGRYFLLVPKCRCVAEDLGVAPYTLVCRKGSKHFLP